MNLSGKNFAATLNKRLMGVFMLVLLLKVSAAQAGSPISSSDTTIAFQHYRAGVSFATSQRYDSALVHFKKALPIFESRQDWQWIAKCLNRVAENEFSTSDYKNAISDCERVLKICRDHLGENHVETAYARLVLGNISLYVKSDLEATLNYYRQALKTFQNTYGEIHADVAKTYVAMGLTNAYFNGRFSMMIEYYNKALNILLRIHKKNHPDVASVYNNLGLVYKEMGDFDTAEPYLQKAVSIYRETIGDKNLSVANCLGNLARIYNLRGDYQKSIEYFERVKRIHQEVYHERHPFVIMVYRGIGLVYYNMGNIKLAEANCLKGIAIAKSVLSPKHSVVAAIYNDLSTYFYQQKNFGKALQYVHEALVANVVNFNNPDLESIPDIGENHYEIREFFLALENIGNVFLAMPGDHNSRVMHAMRALEVTESSSQLLEQHRNTMDDAGDKMVAGHNAARIYEIGLRAALALFNETGDKNYLEKAFYYSEKSKAGILMDAVSEIHAKDFKDVPGNIIEKEKSLKGERSKLQEAIHQEKSKGVNADTTSLGKINDRIFSVGRSYDSLLDIIRSQYPSYFDLKHSQHIATVAEIQQHLDDSTALVEYFIGKEAAGGFVITRTNFHYFNIDSAKSLNLHIAFLRKALNPLDAAPRSDDFDLYSSQASVLSKSLLRKLLPDLKAKSKLVIIADKELSYLPFEVLITDPIASDNFVDVPYLIKKFAISYAYSATVLFGHAQAPSENHVGGILAFAPEYGAEMDTLLLAQQGNFRSKLSALNWNQQEVESISKLFDAKSFYGVSAVEKNFKKYAAGHKIIHLAMHALIDDSDPMKSRLAFSMNSKDSVEDNFLHAFELYNMRLPADLVVLSACETGYGKFESGEGIMSLAHAFTYAGCPSIVMSHWVADDKATAELMQLFYRNLSNGMSKDKALQRAKLDFLKHADVIRENPGFWSAFVVVGNTDPVSIESFDYKFTAYVAAGFGLLMIVGWMIVVKNRRKKLRAAAA